MTQEITKRAIFYIGGFDPKSPEEFFARLGKEKARFETLWDVSSNQTAASELSDDVTLGRFKTSGTDWQVETHFHFLTLDDIVLKYFADPIWKRTKRSVATTADYVFSGTAFAFIKHAWRFSLYFAYPPLAVIFTILLSLFVASLVLPFGILTALLAFGCTCFALVQYIWKRKFVLHLMDLWSFSRAYLHQNQTAIDTKLDAFAGLTAGQISEQKYDEIIFVGHSTGGALILDLASRVSRLDADFSDRASHITVLTIGSTSLKIGLHPKAGWFRERVGSLFSDPKINWLEYQCHTDIINFAKTDPAKLMDLKLTNAKAGNQRPLVNGIRIKDMLETQTYARIKLNFFRIHYQFVFANTKKYSYDFLAICLGPSSAVSRALHPEIHSQDLGKTNGPDKK